MNLDIRNTGKSKRFMYQLSEACKVTGQYNSCIILCFGDLFCFVPPIYRIAIRADFGAQSTNKSTVVKIEKHFALLKNQFHCLMTDFK